MITLIKDGQFCQIEYENESSPTDASPSDAVHTFQITESEIKTVTDTLPQLYNLFVFWFLVWFGLQMLSRIKNAFFKSTKGVDD